MTSPNHVASGSTVKRPHRLDSLLTPRSAAVIGASPDKAKIGGELLHFLLASGYRGTVFPTNPNYAQIDGIRCFPDIAAVDSPIDLAIVAIPAARVLAELQRCAQAGVKNAVVISSGFAEGDGESTGLQERITELARNTGMRVCGPNTEGFFNVAEGVAATFSPTVPRTWQPSPIPLLGERRVGVAAQSGGMGFALFNHGQRAGIGYSTIVTTGNEADLTIADFLDYLVDDPRTDVIVLYLEAIRNPSLFESAAARALRAQKPIIVLKVGRSAAGQRAAASHTASMAGWNTAYEAVFRKYGIIEANDPVEAIALCGLYVTTSSPKGNRAAVVSSSGGAAIIVTDTLERNGFTLPVLAAGTQSAIRSGVPSYGSTANPVDVTAEGNKVGALVRAVEVLSRSDEIDLIVTVHSLSSDTKISFDPVAMAAPLKTCPKPLTSYTYTLPTDFTRARMAQAGIFVQSNLQALGSALAKMLWRGAVGQPAEVPPLDHARSISASLEKRAGSALCEYEVKALLRPFGIAASEEALATSPEQAVSAAEELGYPVALKCQSPAVLHKTEVGAVRLGLASSEAVREACAEIMDSVRKQLGEVPVHGMLVQKMSRPGLELIVGVINDATWGPLVMVGLGGIAVEVFKDVIYRPAPVAPAEAELMLRSLRSSALFDGFRGRPKLDLQSLADLISRLSRLAADNRSAIAEVELNPVILHEEGITIADALLKPFAGVRS